MIDPLQIDLLVLEYKKVRDTGKYIESDKMRKDLFDRYGVKIEIKKDGRVTWRV